MQGVAERDAAERVRKRKAVGPVTSRHLEPFIAEREGT